MLTEDMKTLIANFSAGAVATINENGTPAVSPKATFVVLDDTRIAFGNIRSSGTVRNLRRNPAIEVCFTDILTRRAVRISGTAENIARADADATLIEAYARAWAPYLAHVRSFVLIDITAAERITSPAYDAGFTEAELRDTNLRKLNALTDSAVGA